MLQTAMPYKTAVELCAIEHGARIAWRAAAPAARRTTQNSVLRRAAQLGTWDGGRQGSGLTKAQQQWAEAMRRAR